ncbi:MAG: M23 family metallopeptidase [Chlorobiaceae bacterium]|nr:M23 family metallopeptidase [Chlorobiaceae bacterium]
MPLLNRLAYLATIDMVAQARKVRSALLPAVLAAALLVFVNPAVQSLSGQEGLHAAVRQAGKGAIEKQQSKAAAVKEASASDSNEEVVSTTEQMIEKLVMQIDRENKQQIRTKSPAGREKSIVGTRPSIKPIEGLVSSGFGLRMHPIHKRMIFHAGTDFSAPVGTKVMATADGTVMFSGFDTGYGKKVILDHGNGYQTIYAHLSKAVIRQGQHVRCGDIIAFSGNTGLSTGPHLHYEVRKNNTVVNPTAFFQDDMDPDKFMSLHDTVPDEDSNS